METFIVRVWTPSPELAHEIPADELHGTVERVPSRERLQFRSGTDLLELLKTPPEPGERAALPERLKQT